MTSKPRPKHYATLYGKDHDPFDLIRMSPDRTTRHIQAACEIKIRKKLSDEYLIEELRKFYKRQISPKLLDEIRERCKKSLVLLINHLILVSRSGSTFDKNVKSLDTNIQRLDNSVSRLQKGEIEAIEQAIIKELGFSSARRYFITLGLATEAMFYRDVNSVLRKPELTADSDFKKEAEQQALLASELWPENFLQLLRSFRRWAKAAAETPRARPNRGRRPQDVLKQLARDLHEVFAHIDGSNLSHNRFAQLLNVVLSPLIPAEHRPKGGFSSLARQARRTGAGDRSQRADLSHGMAS